MDQPFDFIDELLTRYQGRKEDLLKELQVRTELHPHIVELATQHSRPKSWRYAWLTYHLLPPGDPSIRASLRKLIEILAHCPEGQQRETLRILEREEIPEEYSGLLFNHTCQIWESLSKRPGVRIFAFRVMMKVARQYPELAQELKAFDQEHYTESLSPGIYQSFKKLVGSL